MWSSNFKFQKWNKYLEFIWKKKFENTNLKRYMHPYVHCRTMYDSQVMEAT